MTPSIVRGFPVSAKRIERFWSYVDVRGPDECWLWTGSRNAKGYGQFGLCHKGRQSVALAHRFVWELAHGPIPPGVLVCHHCDNPPCCNLKCLFSGSAADNSADMAVKGRANTKLSPDLVTVIRDEYRRGATIRQIADDRGIPRATVQNLIAGRTWRYLPGAPRQRIGTKLFREDVAEIRRLRLEEALTLSQIAKMYGIDQSYVSLIARNARYA